MECGKKRQSKMLHHDRSTKSIRVALVWRGVKCKILYPDELVQ